MDKFIAGEIALNVTNDNDAKDLYGYLHECGYKWTGKDPLLPPINLPSRNEKENTSYSFVGPREDGSLGLAFTTVKYDVSHGMEVYSYDRVRDYIRTGKLTLDDFEDDPLAKKVAVKTSVFLTAKEAAKRSDIKNQELDNSQADKILKLIEVALEQGFYETVFESIREGAIDILVKLNYNIKYDKDINSYIVSWGEHSGKLNRETMDNEDISRESQLQS
jgi:hypothetical protein